MKNKRCFLSLLLCGLLVLSAAFSSLAAGNGEETADSMDVLETELSADDLNEPVVSEIEGDPSALLEDVPMLMSVVTPIEEFTRLSTVEVYNDSIGGSAYGNSISGDVTGRIDYLAIASVIPRNTRIELIYELTLPGGIDKSKIFLGEQNYLEGFSVGYLFRSGNSIPLSNSGSFSRPDGINYVNDTTVRVSCYVTNFRGSVCYLSLPENLSVNGAIMNIYYRTVTDVASIGGDGSGGSDSGGGSGGGGASTLRT